MAVQTPHVPLAPDQGIEAGPIEDARARQRRHRRIGAALVAATALAAGVILGFASGGGGSRAGRQTGGHGSGAQAAGHPSAQLPAGAPVGVPPDIGQFGLLAPGVGWAVNGLGFFVTRDGGRRWSTVSVPNLRGDIVADLLATSSPAPTDLILSFTAGSDTYDRTCAHPTTPAIGAGGLAVTDDSGRDWRASALPACQFAYSLSFITPEIGFALAPDSSASKQSTIYGTSDAARSWHRVGTVPLGDSVGSIGFATQTAGWAVAATQAGGGASSRGTLYRTTDGGRVWARSDICRGTPIRSITISCQTPSFFGTAGIMPAVATDSATDTSQLLVYTTKSAGHTWSAHTVLAGQALLRYINQKQPIPFSAPNAHDLFVFVAGTLYTSVDGGRTWSRLRERKLSGYASLDFVSPDYGWIKAGNQFDFTTDGGRHWQKVGSP